MEQPLRVLISGGGTGGHVYPALAIADGIKAARPDAIIRFIGAQGRMEMEKVPMHGYLIDGLWISGFQRSKLWKNAALPSKILSSLLKVRSIIREFKPDVAVGVGGYASGPLLYMAARMGVPTLIQEQNSYPGVTNKMLSGKATKICVAYPGLEAYFPQDKLVFTGNPVRGFKPISPEMRDEACRYFGLSYDKPVVLVTGGSLGAGTINNSLLAQIDELNDGSLQLLWQTGKYYYEKVKAGTSHLLGKDIHIMPFIDRMDLAYAAANIVVARAGAITISELTLAKKPCILVPSPNVAEDHQTKNAMVLVEANAALLVKDVEAGSKLVPAIRELAVNTMMQVKLAETISRFARPHATVNIVREVLKLAEQKKRK